MDEMQSVWTGEAKRRGLSENDIANVSWTVNTALTSVPKRDTTGNRSKGSGEPSVQTRGNLRDLYSRVYTHLDAGRVYILGPGGFGKTSAMITLLLSALEYRQGLSDETRARVPVPVWLSLADWNALEEPLSNCVRRSLERDFPLLRTEEYGGRAIAELVSHRRLSLFLDGFDELPVLTRVNALTEIRNSDLGLKLVVTSRSEEFASAWTDLEPSEVDGIAVSIAPIDVKDAATYLAQGRRDHKAAWASFSEYITKHPNSVPALALNNPLTLSLTRSVYEKRNPWVLSERGVFTTVEEFRKHLFEGLLYSSYADNPSAGQVKLKWLMWMANSMGRSRDLYWWNIPSFVSPSKLFAVRWIVGPGVSAIATSLLIGISYFRERDIEFGLRYGFAAGTMALALGTIATGVLRLRVSPVGREPLVIKPQMPSRSSLPALIVRFFLIACLALLLNWLVSFAAQTIARTGMRFDSLAQIVYFTVVRTYDYVVPPYYFPTNGIVSCGAALILVILKSWSVPLTSLPVGRGARGYRASLRSALDYSIAAACIVGTFGALPFASSEGWTEYAWLGALVFGLSAGLITYLSIGPPALLQMIQVLFAKRRGKVKIVAMLDDAVERGLLRREGWAYQFRHGLVQDYLAERDPSQFS
jgi:hypothetical protein